MHKIGIMVTTAIISKIIDIKTISITIRATVINRINRIIGKINSRISNNRTGKIDFNRINNDPTTNNSDQMVAMAVAAAVAVVAAVREVVDSIAINNQIVAVIGVKFKYTCIPTF